MEAGRWACRLLPSRVQIHLTAWRGQARGQVGTARSRRNTDSDGVCGLAVPLSDLEALTPGHKQVLRDGSYHSALFGDPDLLSNCRVFTEKIDKRFL